MWQRLPRQVGYALASVIGDAIFIFWVKGRRNTVANMRQVLGPEGDQAQARRLARQAMRHYAKTLADFLCLERITAQDIDQTVFFDRWDVFDQALARGKGAIFATMHMGSWDMGGAALGRKGYTFGVLTDVFRETALNEKVVRIRKEKGFDIIPIGRVPKAAVTTLRKNRILGILIDKPVTEGVTIRFFGAPSTLPAGVAALAIRTGAAIIPCCLLRNSDDTFSGIVRDPIFPDATGRFDGEVQKLTQRVVTELESIIRLDPGQWFAFRPMWPGINAGGAQPPFENRGSVAKAC
ncbi:MAG: hypothetical protein Q7R39_09360 [Dehalococcoidia bacterium]|nr:hypothetical protein [Dehalococcoidia bacterium]